MSKEKIEAPNREEPQEQKPIFDTQGIMKVLPHRYPFLMIDKIIELEPEKRVVGIKNVTMDEFFFQGHFPGRPVMPGVLIMEAMAQTGAFLAHVSSNGVTAGKIIFLAGANDFRWRRQVVPGDTMRIELVSVKKLRPVWVMRGTVTVDGKIVATGTLSAAERD